MEGVSSSPSPSPPPPGVIAGVCSELCIPAYTKHVVLPEGGTRSGLRGWGFHLYHFKCRAMMISWPFSCGGIDFSFFKSKHIF